MAELGDLCTGCGKCCMAYAHCLGTLGEAEFERLPEEAKALCRPFYEDADGRVYEAFAHPPGAPGDRCPFLRAGEDGVAYRCAIHRDRPNVCRGYPYSLEQAVRDGCEIIQRLPWSALP